MKKHSLSNDYLQLTTIDYGATTQQLIVKDKEGKDVNVVLGYKNLDHYIKNTPYLGASVGRFAGRIHKNGFALNGSHYSLFTKNEVHLHGGDEGFSFKTWNVEQVKEGENPSITYSYLSKHMEEGYPGNLKVFCTYTLRKNQLVITYEATCDQDTVVNLTNHNYYNLKGSGSILDHQLTLHADKVLEKEANATPTGNFTTVKDSYFDFTNNTPIKKQLANGTGIDDCYVLSKQDCFAVLYAEETGIEMKVSSNQPGVVVYTPEFMEEKLLLNTPLEQYPAICFETQNFPDSPNHSHFPSALLKKGETYTNKSVFEFNVR